MKIDDLVDAVWEMIKKWEGSHYNQPEIVMLCSPKYYCELREMYNDKICYVKSDFNYQIEFLNIIGLKVPVVIRNDMPKNVEYTLMFREDYERQEKEELYRKLYNMFEN